ncbi:hypothetical protein JCM1393_27570 [Clostridium carnis]
MSNVININDIRKVNRKNLEMKAFEQYGVIKAKDDLYLYPEYSFTTYTSELKFLLSEELKMNVKDLLE